MKTLHYNRKTHPAVKQLRDMAARLFKDARAYGFERGTFERGMAHGFRISSQAVAQRLALTESK